MKENKLFPLKKTIVAFAVLSGLAGAFPLASHLMPQTHAASAAVAGLPDFTELVDKVGPAVVNIRTTEKIQAGNGFAEEDPALEFFRRFWGMPVPKAAPKKRSTPQHEEEIPRGVGSGFDDPALVQHDQPVHPGYRRQPMRDGDHRTPFHQRVELRGISQFDFEKPASAQRVAVGKRWVVYQGGVHFRDFSGDGHIHISGCFDRLDNASYITLFECASYLWQFYEYDIAKRVLCVVGDADHCGPAIGLNPFVFLCVFE